MLKRMEPLPAALQEQVRGAKFEERPIGRLGTRMYRLALPGGRGAYLKIASLSSQEDLAAESRRLKWLAGRLPAPRLLHYCEANGSAFLLIGELSGEPAYHSSLLASPRRLLALVAEGLHLVHAVPSEACPFQARAQDDLTEIERRLSLGLIDRIAFAAQNDGMTPEQARAELAATAGLVDDFVFTHGDYYLPNVIVEGWKVTGFVDLALAGVADRYRDLTAMADSISMNLGPEWVPAFVAAYGLHALDPAKVRYYTLLDQFFTDFTA